MYLKRLEMQGFKSFADKTILEFVPGITAVIGPNGSGKSNISDSIRWVLGEQSMKSLRGAKSQDIIFSGTQNRKSLGFAEASLVFDNSDQTLPIEYNEVIITRKIFRSGETNYYINKVQCRLKDIQELFMDTGIGKDGYSIISQGKIDEILSNKSEDRRHIFEEAAGIVKYKSRKEETEKKLEHTKLNLLRINDILNELEQNIEPLKMQSDKAKKYLNLKNELKNIEIGLFIFNINKYKNELAVILENLDDMNNTYTLEENKINAIKDTKEKLKLELEDLQNQLENAQNFEYERKKTEDSYNSDIQIAKINIKNNEENILRYENEKEEAEAKKNSIIEEKKGKENKIEDLKNRKMEYKTKLDEKEQELRKISITFSQKEIEIEEQKKILENNIEKKYEYQNSINIENTNNQNTEKRLNQVKQEISNDILELDSIRIQKEDVLKEFNKIEFRRNSILKEIEENTELKKEIDNKLSDNIKKINLLKEELRLKETRQKFLKETEREKEGYSKTIKVLLKECEENKELSKGINGTLADIIKVPKEYETAIEMCLGSSLQNIVTDTEDDAKRLVNFLKSNNLGRASFYPLTAMKGKQIENIKGKEMIIGIASGIVKTEKKYEQLILNLLGKTVIVNNIQTGIEVAKRNQYMFKIVTVDGDVLNPSGMISGGSIAKKSFNLLGRGREIEELSHEIYELNKKIEEYERATKEEKEEINEKEKLLDILEKEVQEININYAMEKQKVQNMEENISKIKIRLEKIRQDKENLVQNQKNIEYNINMYKMEVDKILNANELLEKNIKEFVEKNKDTQKIIDDLNFDITNLKISVSSFEESENSIDEVTSILQKNLEIQINLIEQKEIEIEKTKKNIIDQKELINQKNLLIKKLSDDYEKSKTLIENIKEQKINLNTKLSESEEEQINQFTLLEELKEQIVKLDVKKSKTEELINQNIDQMWQEYEMTPNNVETYLEPENISLTQKKVNDLRKDIKELGEVNVNSIEEYKNVKQRYDFMCDQRLDLDETIKKLREIIFNMVSNMKIQFKEKFDIINQNFNVVFKELFGGGKAELVLTDENNILESGIEIIIQPPGKKLQNMMLLSGGERALTAIALLFAILKINPSPFCVLDEIEAALDDVNVFRFADYLKKFVGSTQFLVITHRKGTMEAANTVYGVTMEEKGISKLLSMKLK